MDIFEIANQNSTNLQTLYKSVERNFKVEKKLDMLDNFIKSMKHSLGVSINMGGCTLNNFLIGGKYKNVYKLKEERKIEIEKVRKSEVSVEQAVEKHLKDYNKLRVTFDGNFKDGENFKYGALNIGGLGINKYGEFCTVINLKQLEKYKSLAFIREDSLKYVDNNHVNIEGAHRLALII